MDTIESLSEGHLLRYKHAAERLLLQMGITFNVYGDAAGTERILPFDLVPRIVAAQRVGPHRARPRSSASTPSTLFIDDIYHEQKILRDGVIPRDVVSSRKSPTASSATA